MWEDIKEAVSDFFEDLKEWAVDVFVELFGAVLSGIASIIEAIDPPDFMMNYSLSDYIHPDVGYFLSVSGFGDALVVVGAAYVVRIVRRIATLGIW